jgi:hypothetical protein
MDDNFPTPAEIQATRRTIKIYGLVSPNLLAQIKEKKRLTGMTYSEAIYRALKLWSTGKLDDLMPEAGD